MKMSTINHRHVLSVLAIAFMISGISCKRGPNAGDPIPLETTVSVADAHKDIVMDLHKITIIEAVPTSKYLYLRVNEDDREYWMATSPTEVTTGDVYYYNEALIRSAFESKEMQRVFDTIYLVTRIVPEAQAEKLRPKKSVAPPPSEASASGDSNFHGGMQKLTTPVRISEIFADPASFEGRQVEISGTCTKVNEGILNRNWIHIKDGSADDKDLVVTSSSSVKEGDPVKIRAVVRLDKDFGAGYSYEILLEDGVVVE
jgi:hypothetical protein